MNNTLILIILNLVGKIFSFIREMIFSFFYGTGPITDAFNTSTTAATLIFSVITYALSKTYIPTYNEVLKKGGEESGDKFTNNLLNFSLFLTSAIMILGFAFAPAIVKLFAAGYSGEKLKIASSFMRAIILTIYPNIYAAIFSAYLQIKGDFITPALPLIILNIILAITVAISKGNVTIMTIGIFLAYFVQFIIFPRAIRKTGFKRGKIKFSFDENVKKIIILSLPTTFSMAAVYISTIVDQSFASLVATDGGVSIINYALKILRIVSSTFIVPFQVTAYPIIGKLVADNNLNGMKKLTSQTLVKIMILFIPSIIGMMVLSEPIISFVYYRGEFTYNDMIATSKVLFTYTLYLLGPAIVDLLYLSFFSNQNTKIPTVISFIQLGINILLDYALSVKYGLVGLAMATTISQFSSVLMAFVMYKRTFGSLDNKYILKNIGKILIAGAVLGIFAKYFYQLRPSNLWLLVTIAFAGVIYVGIIYLLKVDEFDDIKNAFLKRKKNKKA
ncbi:murein biosynthesis integral membrane protein MurJ [Anaerococcus sp. mt242]|uniref:murein biosynthesis integral membrane protein MurJ n=1 Tax=Anaerococcus sp. mt242 TaxID=2661917 RepID=UPI001933AD6E|nr:murein biosynthesis integral membrane protein MurJ [Anaerococcus sp. mt242]MBM0045644.1 murein biosynthesis integral membrane protein MurJ [Anaerococcus sp. mt242]